MMTFSRLAFAAMTGLATLATPLAAETTPTQVSSPPMQHGHGTATGAMPAHDKLEQEGVATGPQIDLGDLTLGQGFSRATLPGAPVAGGFFQVTNNGTTADRLVAARSPAAARMEIHEMVMNGDVMVMRPLEDGLSLPAGATVVLKPGGFHLMFMQLTGPLIEGETVEVTLTFEQAGEVTLPLHIGAPNAGAGAHH